MSTIQALHGLRVTPFGSVRPSVAPISCGRAPGRQQVLHDSSGAVGARRCVSASAASAAPGASPAAGASSSGDTTQYGNGEKLLSLSDLLQECDDLDEDLLEDDDDALPVWEHEHRVKALPFTEEELREREVFLARQRQQQQEAAAAGQQAAAAAASEGIDPLLQADPLQAVSDIVSAYTAEQGFREMGVQELSVALTAGGGLVDLVLDVRSHAEFAAGPTIPSAVNIPLDLLSDVVRAGQLDPYHSGSVAVVCASGQRSAQATVRLSKVFGFKNVVNVTGGMAAWQRMVAAGSGGGGGGGGCACGSSSGGCGH